MPASSPFSSPPKSAFTIVEMLVTISIIGLLLAILLPSLSVMNKRGKKTSELNSLRQVAKAWLMYANNNNDAALPGYMEVAVQAPKIPDVQYGWGVTYKYQDGVNIPPAGNPAGDPNFNIAGPWTWRLLPYFDYAREIVLGYDNDPDIEWLMRGPDPNDPLYEISSRQGDALTVALQPAFGYNGFYVGGYWRMPPDNEDPDDANCPWPSPQPRKPTYKFYKHREAVGATGGAPVSVATTISNIRRSSEIVTFCSSTDLAAPAGMTLIGKLGSETPGSHWVTPPIVGTTVQWGIGQSAGDTGGPMYQGPAPFTEGNGLNKVYFPLARHGSSAAVMYADGHIDQQTMAGLEDQRKWIDSANSRDYTHQWYPCPP